MCIYTNIIYIYTYTRVYVHKYIIEWEEMGQFTTKKVVGM